MRYLAVLLLILSLPVPPWKIEVAVQAALAASHRPPVIKTMITPAATPIRK